MRKELLKKRGQLNRLINDINMSEKTCDKKKSFKLNRLKQENLEKYRFINNLLKVI